MSTKLNKREIEKFSRQIILKNIGALGQRKNTRSKSSNYWNGWFRVPCC